MEGKSVSETRIILARQMMPYDANPVGNVHGGVVMRYIDEAAGAVAIRHARGTAVTASVDRLDFRAPIYVGEVVTVKASLNLVARTSMEVGVRVEAECLQTGEVRHTVSAYLTFVALDENHKPKPVAPLILESDEDRRRNREALARRETRLAEKVRENQG